MSGNRILLALALVALATLPLWMGSAYYINISTQILFFAIFALALNILVGYGGLVSLGHAGLFGIAGYAVALMLEAGYGHIAAIVVALVVTMATAAVFAVLSLRATGIGFLMITLTLGQILWGIAYRWASLTHGDNGVNIHSRPTLGPLNFDSPSAFYYLTLVIFIVTMLSMAVLVRSPFGVSLAGTRDQPRRMTALGYNVWLIRFVAFLLSGFWSAVAGLLFAYYNQFVSPQGITLQSSAEVLLMVISGGTGTLLGPVAGSAILIIMKNVVSAYIERWNLVLGVVFVLIIMFMPEGLIPGLTRLMRGGRRSPASKTALQATPASGGEP